MAASKRVLVACVAENTPRFHHEVTYLFKSLRYLGGRLADAQAIAYFVDSVDAEVTATLAALNVAVQIVDRLDERCLHANKIQMLEDTADYDYLVALDTDIVIARDFSAQLIGHSIAAKPADSDPLTHAEWKTLFGHFNLPLPETRFLTSFNLSLTIPYFNSGVLVIPQIWVSPLRTLWREYTVRLLDAYGELAEVEKYRYCYRVDFDAAATMVGFGMMLKTVTGLEVGGQGSHANNDGLAFVPAGQSIEVAFEFCNLLVPGSYFGNAGVSTHENGSPKYLHRIVDAVMFRVKQINIDRPISGYINLTPPGGGITIRAVRRVETDSGHETAAPTGDEKPRTSAGSAHRR